MRAEWLRRIYKFQYYADGQWYDAVITDKKIEDDTVYVTTATTDSAALTITKIRLIDTGGGGGWRNFREYSETFHAGRYHPLGVPVIRNCRNEVRR